MMDLSKLSAASLTIACLGVATLPAQASESPRTQQPEARSATALIAQADTCRRVSSSISALNVRRAPSLTAEVVDVVPGGRNVTLDNLGVEGWAPILEPVQGYVSTNFLTRCETAAETVAASVDIESDQCRQVMVPSGLNVRIEPNRYSERLTALPFGTNVEVTGAATTHWTEITAPVDGFVAERFLGSCD